MRKIVFFFFSLVRFIMFFLTTAFSGALFSGCQTPLLPEKDAIQVVSSFYPLAFLAEEIGGDMVNAISLAGSQEIHEFHLSPGDILSVFSADLVILQGADLEPWGEDLVPQIQKKNIPLLVMAEHLSLFSLVKNEEEEAEHHDGSEDPHTWLDPVLAQQMTSVLTEKMIEVAPQNRKYFTKNSEILLEKFKNIDREFAQKLNNCDQKAAFISHDAFGYLARRYHFELLPLADISTANEPSIAHLLDLKSRNDIRYILEENNETKRFSQTLAREMGLSILPVFSLETNERDFFTGYEENLKSLLLALQCHS